MSLEGQMAPTLQILQLDFGERAVQITFMDTARETTSVSEIRQLIIDPNHERFAAEIADMLDTARHLVTEAEDVRRGTPLTRR